MEFENLLLALRKTADDLLNEEGIYPNVADACSPRIL